MLEDELEDKLNKLNTNTSFSVAECLKTYKEGNITFNQGWVYVFSLDPDTGELILLLTLLPQSSKDLGPDDHWIATTRDAEVNAYSAEVLDIYIKVLQLVKQYLIEKDDEIKNGTRAK